MSLISLHLPITIMLAPAAYLVCPCVQAVFGAYGIGVDPRHLGLIADFMTHTGGYRCACGCCWSWAETLVLSCWLSIWFASIDTVI